MNTGHPISQIAALLSDPARASMMLYLLEARAITAGELCRYVNISPQSGSSHLSKLVTGGLLAVHQQGRCRYFELANPGVANLLEAFGVVATRPVPTTAANPLRFARTCYDHLAGIVAVALTSSLQESGFLVANNAREYRVTANGRKAFSDLGVDIEALASKRRPLTRQCLDWTERKPHLAGSLGAALLHNFLKEKWVARLPGGRAVRITERGQQRFHELGVHIF
jgi:DNA-binding transcriptional ArsR family regulator